MDWLEGTKIPIGKWAAGIVSWMTDNLDWFFDNLSLVLEMIINNILLALQAPPPLVMVAMFAGLTWWWRRSIGLVVFVVLSCLFILNQGYWEETTETLTLVVTACLVCMGVGIPIGIWAAHNPRVYSVMRPILDLMQTLPTFVYLIHRFLWHRHGAGADRYRHFCGAGADPPDPSGHFLDAKIADRGGPGLRRHTIAGAL
jgi:glycine betaine/proline transport system permease protein